MPLSSAGADDMRAPTVSIGIAGRRLGKRMESLLLRADHTLQAAKTAVLARIENDISADQCAIYAAGVKRNAPRAPAFTKCISPYNVRRPQRLWRY